MIKSSLLLMAALTVLCAVALRWRERRSAEVSAATVAAAGRGRSGARRLGLLARGKAGLDRWVTAAAIAAVATIAIMGGLHWLRVLGG